MVALNLAKALNCEGRMDSDCCEICLPCRKVNKGVHPDVSLIEPEASSLKIEQAREAQRDISLRPYEGKKKVYLFDQAERMTEQCENALLKTLEEPTGEVLLILITSSPHALLPTVLSRCQRIRFEALPQEEVVSYLMRNRSLDEERARFIASLAGGSLGWALRADAEDLIALRDETITGLESALKGEMGVALDLAEVWAKDKERLSGRLEVLLTWVRDLAIYRSTKEISPLLVNRDLADRILEGASSLSSEALLQFFGVLQEMTRGLSRYANARLSLEGMFMRMRSIIQEKEEIAYADRREG